MHDLGDLEEVFERHLDLAVMDLELLADSFCNLVFSTDYCLYDGPKDLDALDRLSIGLACLDGKVFGQMSGAARELLRSRLSLGTGDDSDNMMEFWSRDEGRCCRVFFELTDLASEIRFLVDAVRKEIDASDRKRGSLQVIEMERLQVVENAVDYWKQFSNRDIPTTDIKPAQPFAKFLADIFLCLEINSSPEKAYGSWLKQQNRPLSQE